MKFEKAQAHHHETLKPLFWQQWELELHQNGGTYNVFNTANDPTVDMYVLLDDNNTLMACVAITQCDLPERKYFTPWMSYVYVLSEYRGRGLVHKIIDFCKSLEPVLYLFCRPYLVELYKKAGFETIDSCVMDDVTMYIMHWARIKQ
jgi:hypothetical protein